MLVQIIAAKCIGIDAVRVLVEVEIDRGVGIHLCGLADTAVKESLLRTVTALQAIGYRIPGKKIVINLAPADLQKNGSGYDLPIAVGSIAASGQAELPLAAAFLVMGELGLDGSVRDIAGALPFTELAGKEKLRGAILPAGCALEASELKDIDVYAVRHLSEAVRVLSGVPCPELLVREAARDIVSPAGAGPGQDLADIIGQEGARRGIEIAAAGGHNILMLGAPGAGKSSLAKAIAGILPPLTREEALVTSKIYSIAGKGNLRCGLMWERPFRAPHYSASLASMIGGGGGDNILPGEVSLAQNGVLFLDEVAQMPRSVIEALRGPLEERNVHISRLRSKVDFPASFMLVAAANPCPCGYWGEGDRCRCSPSQRLNYLSRLSGPLMDRIDIQLWVRPVGSSQLASRVRSEPSAAVAARVRAARDIQHRRFAGEPVGTNAEMTNKQLARFCRLDDSCRQTMLRLMERTGLSMRAYFRIIKVARTSADLAGEPEILPAHLLEAAGFRFLDRPDAFE
ncbi:MAG: YifB family Mg chelatase-like AAA ATPase [Bacteroidales bacterium]|nr:YifB family Mg chelatase-like AAA ATPase [Bacteroidales bacterium]